jgi:hypothetical protein
VGNSDRIVSLTSAALLVAAVAIRLPSLASPPMGFSAMRQHHSALIARARFLNEHPTAGPDWQRATANDYVAQATIPEPQVIERLDAFLYELTGAERLHLARWFSLALWLAGALCLRSAARRLWGPAGGLTALVVCLFLPYSIGASSSIQSDTLAFALMSAALAAWARTTPGVDSTTKATAVVIFAVLLSMAAGFVRVMTLFWLAPIGVVALWRPPLRAGARLTRIAGVVALMAVPAIGYAAFRWSSDPLFGERVGATFAPGLLVTTTFWRGWAGQAWRAFGGLMPIAVVAAVAVVAGRTRERMWLIAMWLGYAAYGLLFNLHVSTHPYYQTLAVPMIALSIAAAAHLAVAAPERPLAVVVPGALVALMLLVWGMRAGALKPPPHADDVPLFAAIGERVNHSRRTIILGDDWGVPLRYYAGVSGRYWPATFEVDLYRPLGAHGIAVETAASRWKQFNDGLGGAEYFIVTDARELARQPDLQAILFDYPIVDRTGQFTIFDLRRR